jgi:Tfp pilus assembly protein PilV
MQPNPTRQPRGVSLIEAVVALAVMATGLLGIAGVQSTLRANSDIAKQRAEAVRLAQERIEDLRYFRDMTGTAPSYVGITSTVDTTTPARSNTTFTRTTTVTPMQPGAPDLQAVPRAKSVSVTVSWPDRTGQTQQVTLYAAVSGIAPALAGSLAVPPDGGDPMRQPLNRDRGIPPTAVDIGGNQSAFRPPAVGGGVVWVFNNTSGLISLCALITDTGAQSDLRANNIGNCTNNAARLVSGYISFNLAGQQTRPAALDNLEMTLQQSAPPPYAGTVTTCAMDTASQPATYTAYYCAVPVDNTTSPPSPWSGSLVLENRPRTPLLFVQPGGAYRLCRYIIDGKDLVITTNPNSVTVATSFSNIGSSLANRNFVVISSANSCSPPFPSPYPVPNQGTIVLPNPFPLWLVQHQPAP